jgi:O-acetyl-ADP-ribose deacetylase (regulator of RNase III)
MEAAEVATEEVRRFLEEDDKEGKLERVVFCCFENKDVRAYEYWLP